MRGAYQANGELRASMAENEATIGRLSEQAKAYKEETARLNSILLAREAVRDEQSKQFEIRKEVIRVESTKPTDFGRCINIYLPADAVRGLREGAGHGGASAKSTSAWNPTGRVSTSFNF